MLPLVIENEPVAGVELDDTITLSFSYITVPVTTAAYSTVPSSTAIHLK